MKRNLSGLWFISEDRSNLFSAHERRQIAENLGEIWGVHKDIASEMLEEDLTESEKKELDELNDFDFGDL